ncbi:hypothetical protein N657DRAFT_274786 [Parathielavia appendiculata]|uniref:Uncharacterized protein n=1 Tax=Parathielavia appendiculata TaxID=2587402 RepID=A0AAN6U602_9PEZI|nr:hypothetical protein N657DRAFT_274786 [Parathielavia appendiculata]
MRNLGRQSSQGMYRTSFALWCRGWLQIDVFIFHFFSLFFIFPFAFDACLQLCVVRIGGCPFHVDKCSMSSWFIFLTALPLTSSNT